MKVERRADVGNMLCETEMALKRDAEELDMVCQRKDVPAMSMKVVPAMSMKVRLLGDFSRWLVP